MPPAFRFLTLLTAAALPAGGAAATDGAAAIPSGPPPRIRQITLPNPVSDPLVLVHRSQLTPVPADGVVTQLPGVIEVRHEKPSLGYVWDPVECRVLFVWRGASMTGLIQVAEGPSPLGATVGVYGPPQYFGYRLVEGAPEFLYRLGRLAVEERLEPSADGSQLVQRWKVYQSDFDVLLHVPERWKDHAKISAGTWADGFYKVPKALASELTLTWAFGKPPGLPPLPEAWTKALAALPPTPIQKEPETHQTAPKPAVSGTPTENETAKPPQPEGNRPADPTAPPQTAP